MHRSLRRVARAFTSLYLLQTLLAVVPAYAQVSAAPGALSGQKPLIDAAANGVPLVLIAPPSAAGVSRNQFNQFNVAPNGLILNNATGNVQTQLGGWIKSNLQLGATPARIILNEVTGPNASQLRGVIEVGGQRADVVIANPNGITCDGCGFLNTSRATLATGTPMFGSGGALTGFDVRAGVLNIGAGGLSATGQQQLDLYARGLVVEGELWAQNLQAVIGANQVAHGAVGAPAQASPGTPEGAAPRFAVDVKALGGMYAGSIYLIATDKGLGVNSTGRLATLAGNLVLSANGELTVKDSYAAGNASLVSTGQVNLTGQNQAEGNFVVQGQGIRTAGASVFAPQIALDAGAGSLDNTGGAIQATSDAADALRINATGIQNTGGAIYAQSDLSLATGALSNQQGAIVTQGKLTITTGNQAIDNAGGLLQAKASVALDSGTADLGNAGGTIVAGTDASIRAGTLDTRAGSGAVSTQGAIVAGTSLNIAAAQLQAGGAALASGGAMTIGVSGQANIDRAGIDAGGKLTLQAGALQAGGAKVAGNGDIAVTTTASAAIASGTWSAQGNLAIISGGMLDAANTNLRAGNDLTAQATGISTANADILVRNLTLDAGTGALNNASGKLQATGNLSARAQGLNNTAGTIAANAGVTINAGAGALNNTAGVIDAGAGDASLTAGNLTNSVGAVITAGATSISATGDVVNAGLINSTAGETRITAGALRNTGRIYGDSVAITAATTNSADAAGVGAVIASRLGDLVITGPVSNTGGSLILSLNDLTINGAVTNEGSTLSAARNLSITGQLTNANAGFSLTTLTRLDTTGGYFIRPADSTVSYRPDELLYSMRDSQFWILPSATYPTAQFGGETKPLMSSCVERIDNYAICGNFYSTADPIWALMRVASPGAGPGEPPAGCANDAGDGGPPVRLTGGGCGAYWSSVDSYQAGLPAFNARLDAAITAFNIDLATRTVNNWFETTVTSQTMVETAIVSSQPAQVLAGGNITIAGGRNQDSLIVAGGNLDGGGLQNAATQGGRQTTQEGTEVYSWGDHDGGLFGSGFRRNRSAAQPLANAPVVTSFDLPVVKYLANTPPSSVAAPVSLPGTDPAQSQPPASITAAVLKRAQTADTGERRAAPAKAEGYLTVTAEGAVRVPGSQLFSLNRAPAARFLVETDPAFTGYRNWLSSDYFLGQLAIDPERSFKRYGDGFAEQRLVDDQILALTGRRFLSGYSATESEYQDLLDAGVQYAKQFQLSPGVRLSAAQMASLTSDIVWLEVKAVALPDGSTVQALVPTVYLRRPVEGDLSPSGSLIAGGNVTLRSAGDVAHSGTIFASGDAATGDGRLIIEGRNVNNSGTFAGNAISVNASQTINTEGGIVQGLGAASSAALNARDIILRTTTQTSSREVAGANGVSTGTGTNVDRIATISAGSITLAALNNIDLKGASVKATGDLKALAGGSITSDAVQTGYTLHVPLGGSSQGRTGYVAVDAATQQLTNLQAGGNITIAAAGDASFKGTNADAGNDLSIRARNISIEAAKESLAVDQQGVKKSGYERFAQSDESLAGGNFTAGNNATLIANGDKAQGQGNIAVTGANIIAKAGQASLSASNNVVVQNATTQHSNQTESYQSSKGFLASSSTQRSSSNQTTRAEGRGVSGATVAINAGGDIKVQGSNVVSDTQTTLSAAGKVSITAATEAQTSTSFVQEKKSGLGALGGLSYGSHLQSTNGGESATRAVASSVGSLQGNVNITAGGAYTQVGSNVVAPKGDVTIVGATVAITEAREAASSHVENKFKESGIAVTVSNPLLSALETTSRMGRQAGNTDDPRMKALAVAAAAGAASDAAKAIAANPANLGGVGINFSLGTKQQQSTTTGKSNTAAGSTVAAGGNVNITATGAGADSHLIVQGSKISAGNTANLEADGGVYLLAAQNTSEQHTTSKGSSASIGVGINFGGSSNGISFNAGTSVNRGNSDGSDLSWSNTHVTAGNTVNIHSGGNTTMNGAVVKANTVNAKVDGDLIIGSLQDTSKFDEKQSSAGFGVTLCIPPICAGASSVSASASKNSINSNYNSVGEQSGIRAGDGGFNVEVKGATRLAGGAITSTNKAVQDGKNTFHSAGGVTLTDIQNSASYKASGVSLSGGYSGAPHDAQGNPLTDNQGNAIPGQVVGAPGVGSAKGNATSTTQAAISGIAGNTAARTGDAETGIKPIFDAAKVRDDVNAQVAITQAALPGVTKAWAGYANSQAATAQTAEDKACWAEGGACRVAGHVAIGALAGGTAGAAGAGVSQAVIPAIGDALKGTDLPAAVKQTVVAGLGMAIGGAVGGTAGAITGGNATVNNYLTEKQWQAFADKRSACRGEPGCLRNADAEYTRLSQLQDNALATCDIRRDCAKLIDEVKAGKAQQLALVTAGALPDGFMGAANLQQLGERLASDPALREQVSRAITADYLCKTNPVKCTQQAAAAALGLTGVVAAGAIAISMPALAAAAGVAIEVCVASPILCANKAGLTLADIAAGEALGGASISAGVAGAGAVAVKAGGSRVTTPGKEVVADAPAPGALRIVIPSPYLSEEAAVAKNPVPEILLPDPPVGSGPRPAGSPGIGFDGYTPPASATPNAPGTVRAGNSSLEVHLFDEGGATLGKDVYGTHDMRAFLDALDANGGRVINKAKATGTDGIYEISYQLPGKNQTVKTVFDPKIYPQSDMSSMAESAAQSAINQATASGTAGKLTVNVGGLKWVVVVSPGPMGVLNVKTAYPIGAASWP